MPYFPSFHTLCRHSLFTTIILRIWLEDTGPNRSYIVALIFIHTHFVSSQKKKQTKQIKTKQNYLSLAFLSLPHNYSKQTQPDFPHSYSSSKAFENKEKNTILFLSFCPWHVFAALKTLCFLLSKMMEKRLGFFLPCNLKDSKIYFTQRSPFPAILHGLLPFCESYLDILLVSYLVFMLFYPLTILFPQNSHVCMSPTLNKWS